MKFKLKTLVAAAAMAVSAMPVFATINSSANPTLLLVAYDSSFATNATYFRNLGTLSQLTTSQTFSVPGTNIFNTQLSGVISAGTLGWGIIALDNSVATAPIIYTAAKLASVTPANSAVVDGVNAFLTGSFPTYGGLDAAGAGYAFLNGVVQATGGAAGGAGLEYTGNAAPGALGAETNAQGVAGNVFAADAGVGFGDNLNLFKTTYTSVTQQYLNPLGLGANGGAAGGYFTLLAGGNVTWTNPAAVSAVPLPAAALLFAPGLLGMLGVARRRRTEG
jgi:hypothetical protein